jgi:hypothetical protein
MSLWNGLRFLVFLRRIARSVERIADSQAELVEIERERHDREIVKKRPRATEFGSFDVEESNARWRKEQEAREYGQVPEDAT